MFQREAQNKAALMVQAAWRSLLTRRVFKLMRIAECMKAVILHMEAAAIKIQGFYRGRLTRAATRPGMRVMMQEMNDRKRAQVQKVIDSIVRIQRNFRWHLARKEFQRLLQLKMSRDQVPFGHQKAVSLKRVASATSVQGAADVSCVHVDTWRPSPDLGGAALDDAGRAPCDSEVEKLKVAGLEPFYCSESSEVARHRIGGLMASKMQLAALPADDDTAVADEFPVELWDVYPRGISAQLLDEDLSLATQRGRRNRQSPRRPRRLRSSSSPHSPHLLPSPSNTERRAQAREEARNAASQPPAAAALGLEHPLLDSPPPHWVPQPPSEPSPYGRRSGRSRIEDCSWGEATSFCEPRLRRIRAPRELPPLWGCRSYRMS
eukprot:gnl/TRDRNA2_/TRDRNA2_35094_c0_seq1.p1 gnl/TRDRNA2_/TRDRNA2_35094_c0~~gnl/TRDRNA2_/TRDRNA2_35094_c0_seq1.p1  ORF type:complete len:377 (+),score=46.62 gnl/TRDRNA2_/TRDRNA2_35094_c0_seq1:2-1132(+)